MNTVKVRLKNGEHLNVDFSPGDIMIDCGANIGEVSVPFALMGVTVLAYEPNMHAFEKLSDRFKDYRNVKCFNSAVSYKDGKAKLFLHENANVDPLKYSTGSSLVVEKQNVNSDDYIETNTIDLARVIKKIRKAVNKNVHILKIDIEGAECDLMERLMDEDLLRDIPYIFVETHEKKIPSLVEKTRNMIDRAKKLELDNINFNWI
jgi:FkbM family methyltransferase